MNIYSYIRDWMPVDSQGSDSHRAAKSHPPCCVFLASGWAEGQAWVWSQNYRGLGWCMSCEAQGVLSLQGAVVLQRPRRISHRAAAAPTLLLSSRHLSDELKRSDSTISTILWHLGKNIHFLTSSPDSNVVRQKLEWCSSVPVKVCFLLPRKVLLSRQSQWKERMLPWGATLFTFQRPGPLRLILYHAAP